MGKWILVIGVVLMVVGAAIWLMEIVGLPLGRLPGDVRLRGEKWTFHFPIATCVVLSVALTVLLNLILAVFRR